MTSGSLAPRRSMSGNASRTLLGLVPAERSSLLRPVLPAEKWRRSFSCHLRCSTDIAYFANLKTAIQVCSFPHISPARLSTVRRTSATCSVSRRASSNREQSNSICFVVYSTKPHSGHWAELAKPHLCRYFLKKPWPVRSWVRKKCTSPYCLFSHTITSGISVHRP